MDSSSVYPMSDQYITGVPLLDEQHGQLYSLTDQARNLLKDENMLYKFDELKEILNGLRTYTLSHFSAEEDFMKKASYNQLEEHLKLHRSFIERLNQADEEVSRISLGNQDSILIELLDYLNEWLLQHIQNVDVEMVKAIEAAC
ncbi:MAG: hemerythrin family protein [Lachnospiraceae bacterium]|nr:hemerythrin family protein [Lachnospiraceae bacterium]